MTEVAKRFVLNMHLIIFLHLRNDFFAFWLAIKPIFQTISEIIQPFGSLFWPVA